MNAQEYAKTDSGRAVHAIAVKAWDEVKAEREKARLERIRKHDEMRDRVRTDVSAKAARERAAMDPDARRRARNKSKQKRRKKRK